MVDQLVEKSSRQEIEFKEEMAKFEREITKSYSEQAKNQNQRSFDKGLSKGDEEGYERCHHIGYKDCYEKGYRLGRASETPLKGRFHLRWVLSRLRWLLLWMVVLLVKRLR